MYSSIVVPLDGSPFAEHALPCAARMAREFGAKLCLVHVHVPMPAAHLFEVPLLTEASFEAETEKHVRDYLAETADRLKAEGVDVETSYTNGRVVPELRAALERHAADLVVMTTHGRGGLVRFWIGSTADQLVRETRVPTLLLRPGEDEAADVAPPPFQRILVTLDGSAEAEQILPHAISLGAPGCTDVRLLRIVSPIVPLVYPGNRTKGERTDGLETQALSYLGGIATRLEGSGARVTVDVIANVNPATAILEYAELERIELIAMATHGRTGVQRLLIGSVADKVMRGAFRPILLLRPA
jgi:nucleotide-binding universal stress UspA family protein